MTANRESEVKTFLMFAVAVLGLSVGLSAAARGGSHYHAPRSSYSSHSTEHVSGYVRKNGTYVAPYYRTAPNSTKLDNWSTKGNVNPYTGKPGTRNVEDPIYSPGYMPPGAKPQDTSSGH